MRSAFDVSVPMRGDGGAAVPGYRQGPGNWVVVQFGRPGNHPAEARGRSGDETGPSRSTRSGRLRTAFGVCLTLAILAVCATTRKPGTPFPQSFQNNRRLTACDLAPEGDYSP